jgi:hypothetical protein
MQMATCACLLREGCTSAGVSSVTPFWTRVQSQWTARALRTRWKSTNSPNAASRRGTPGTGDAVPRATCARQPSKGITQLVYCGSRLSEHGYKSPWTVRPRVGRFKNCPAGARSAYPKCFLEAERIRLRRGTRFATLGATPASADRPFGSSNKAPRPTRRTWVAECTASPRRLLSEGTTRTRSSGCSQRAS